MIRALAKHAPAAVAVVVLLVVGMNVIAALDVDSDEYQRTIEESEAYCYQSYDDAALYNAMIIGSHGGLHCQANDGEPHLHDVTERAKMAAYLANESGRTVDAWPDDRYEPRHKRGYLPDFMALGSILLFVGMVFAAIKYAPGMARRGR